MHLLLNVLLSGLCIIHVSVITTMYDCRNSSEESDRNQAMLSALATFFKQVGVPISNKNTTTNLERCQSFVAKDRRAFPKFSKSKQKVCTGLPS